MLWYTWVRGSVFQPFAKAGCNNLFVSGKRNL